VYGVRVTGKEYATQNNAKQQQRPTAHTHNTHNAPHKNGKKSTKPNQNNTPTPKNKTDFCRDTHAV